MQQTQRNPRTHCSHSLLSAHLQYASFHLSWGCLLSIHWEQNESVTINGNCLQSADVVATELFVMKLFTMANMNFTTKELYSWSCVLVGTAANVVFHHNERKAPEEAFLLGTDAISLFEMSKRVSVCNASYKCSRFILQTL